MKRKIGKNNREILLPAKAGFRMTKKWRAIGKGEALAKKLHCLLRAKAQTK